MRIAQVSPLYESVPPKLYGGTERVVSYLTEELVKRGHEVTLFASGDSETAARLIAPCEKSLRLDPESVDHLAWHILMLERVQQHIDEFDIVHFHIDYMHYPFSRGRNLTHVTTLHGRLDIPDLEPLYREFSEMPLVSISDAQRKPLPFANWVGTVYHGLPLELFQNYNETAGDYLIFLGRISPEKRPDRAIDIANRAGMRLVIAAKVDDQDKKYFEEQIKPLIDKSPYVEFIGEVAESEKNELLCGAYAFLFPIDWPEPFGIVMIESMACGTPVIAYPGGAVPEVLDPGVTGFIVDSQEAAVRALEEVADFDRRRCRQVFKERFSAARMAQDYEVIYRRLVEAAAWQKNAAISSGSRMSITS